MTFSSASTLDRISLYLGTCSKIWIGIYLSFCAVVSLKSLMLHVAAIGLLLCLLSYFRLPASDPKEVFKLLGRDPLNLDGSPSRTISRGVLGLIAHRAAPLDAPENSIEAVKKAKKAGAKTIHCNLTFTSDGIAVALRPRDLKELQKDMDKSSPHDLTYKQIQDKLDIAINHPLSDEFSPAKVAKIEDFVDVCLAEDLKVMIDVSLPSNLSLEVVVDYVTTLFSKNPDLYSKAIVMSHWPHILFGLRQKEPKIVTGLAWTPTLLQKTFPRSFSTSIFYLSKLGDKLLSWSIHEFLWYFLGVALIVVDKNEITLPYVQSWRSKGIRVIASPVNRSLERLYFEKQLRLTCMADTMDEIGIDQILQDDQ